MSVKRAFESLGWEVGTFHSQAEHPLKPIFKPFVKMISGIRQIILGSKWNPSHFFIFDDQSYRESKFLERAESFKPSWILVIRGNGYRQTALERLRKQTEVQKLIGWWVKDPRADSQMLLDAALYDHYFCIHQFGYKPGGKITHLPAIGTDRTLYKPSSSQLPLGKAKVLLLGGFSQRRYEFIKPLLRSDLSSHLEIIGPGWLKQGRWRDLELRAAVKGSGVWGEQMVQSLSRAYMVVNVNSWDPRERPCQNLRLFDVPCCGTLLVTDDALEVREHFQVGKELDVFLTPEELLDRVRFYINHPEIRHQIALAGLERSKTLPSILDRVSSMIEASLCE